VREEAARALAGLPAASAEALISSSCAAYSALMRTSHPAVQYRSWAGPRRRPGQSGFTLSIVSISSATPRIAKYLH